MAEGQKDRRVVRPDSAERSGKKDIFIQRLRERKVERDRESAAFQAQRRRAVRGIRHEIEAFVREVFDRRIDVSLLHAGDFLIGHDFIAGNASGGIDAE